jgi:DNA-binding IclR family transcriptional regulator
MDDEECELGLRCISMPLRDYSGAIIASLSVFGNTDDMSDEYIHSMVYPALKKATATICYRLGYIAPPQK